MAESGFKVHSLAAEPEPLSTHYVIWSKCMLSRGTTRWSIFKAVFFKPFWLWTTERTIFSIADQHVCTSRTNKTTQNSTHPYRGGGTLTSPFSFISKKCWLWPLKLISWPTARPQLVDQKLKVLDAGWLCRKSQFMPPADWAPLAPSPSVQHCLLSECIHRLYFPFPISVLVSALSPSFFFFLKTKSWNFAKHGDDLDWNRGGQETLTNDLVREIWVINESL